MRRKKRRRVESGDAPSGIGGRLDEQWNPHRRVFLCLRLHRLRAVIDRSATCGAMRSRAKNKKARDGGLR
jgi:hypothetical protein